jgi:hypothetical protein
MLAAKRRHPIGNWRATPLPPGPIKLTGSASRPYRAPGRPLISRTFGPMGLLRDRGFGTVFVAALRDRGTPSGLMVLGGPGAGIMEVEAVHALELLSVLAGVTLARISTTS